MLNFNFEEVQKCIDCEKTMASTFKMMFQLGKMLIRGAEISLRDNVAVEDFSAEIELCQNEITRLKESVHFVNQIMESRIKNFMSDLQIDEVSQKIILAHNLEGRTFKTIAKKFNLPKEKVMKLYNAAIETLNTRRKIQNGAIEIVRSEKFVEGDNDDKNEVASD